MQSRYTPGQFQCMSYEAASHMGLKIVQQAAETEAWCDVIEPLIELRDIMRHHAVDVADPRIARAYKAAVKLNAAGYRLERTSHSETRPTKFQILRENNVVRGAGYSLTLDDVTTFVVDHC